MPPSINLECYFDRIGIPLSAGVDIARLRELHFAHACAIPFENIDTLTGTRVSLEIEAIEEKLIQRRRGGYCFEQNTLFMAVLEALGFEPLPLAARVLWNRDNGTRSPRTHMVLLVPVSGRTYLCDVGFGGPTLTAPIELTSDVVQQTPHETARVAEDAGVFVLELSVGGSWRPAYEFDLQPQRAVDYEVANHFVQTYPASPFHQTLMAGKPDAGGRWTLGGRTLRRYEAGGLVSEREVASITELRRVLAEHFALSLPDSTSIDEGLSRIFVRSGE